MIVSSEAASAVRLDAPAELRGDVSVPGDKSISHRAALLNAVSSGTAEIRNYAPGEDCQSTLHCLAQLGVRVEAAAQVVRVQGAGLDGLREPEQPLDCGNSGTTMRLLSGLLAGQPFLSVLTGDASLRSRPMHRVVEPLRSMGASVWGRDGDRKAPLAIRGRRPLTAITHRSPVASAQAKSAVLIAGLWADGPTEVVEPAPSRDHTERMLAAMGAHLSVDGTAVQLEHVPASLTPVSLAVPGDLSSAAFWIGAACSHPNASVTTRGVGLNPGRVGFIEVLQGMGARIRIEGERLEGGEPVGDVIAETSELRAVDVGGDIIPSLVDELPLLAVLACFARGTTRIRDAAELRHKESDRISAMASQLALLGARIDEQPDGWVIEGTGKLHHAVVDSHGDHRVAMALAVAGLASQGVTVQGANCVAISYPGFWEQATALSHD